MKNLLTILALSTTLFSCGIKKLKPLETLIVPIEPPVTGVNVQYCTKESELGQDVKTLFVVDRSASNHASVDGGTDPERLRRYGSLQDFFTNYTPKENEFFSILEFRCGGYTSNGCSGSNSGQPGYSDPSATPNKEGDTTIEVPGNTYHPFINLTQPGDRDLWNAKLAELKNKEDPTSAGTTYNKTLKEIQLLILDDAKKAKERFEIEKESNPNAILKPAIYRIVFSSDGAPSDTGVNNFEEYIYDEVENIVKLSDHPLHGDYIYRVSLGAAFYNKQDSGSGQIAIAKALLAEMAARGRGKFISFFDGDVINWNALLDAPVTFVDSDVEWMIVNNLNTAWPFYLGNLGLDTDGDGLPDFYETIVPACLGKIDCDGNGFSDLVEFRKFHQVCRVISGIGGVNVCDTVEFQVEQCDEKNANGSYKDVDGDGLNDCEERLLGTDRELYDTNLNGVPDYLAVKFGVTFARCAGNPNGQCPLQDSLNTDGDKDYKGDLMSNLAEIKANTPPSIPNHEVPGLKYQQYHISTLRYSDRPFAQCYNVNVTDVMSLRNGNDKVSVDIVFRETSGSGKAHYKRVVRPMVNGNVVFPPEDFLFK